MVRVPGSSGDSGFHRESQEDEDQKIKLEQGAEASSEIGSPQTLVKEEGSTTRQSPGRSSVAGNEVDSGLNPELEAKPHPPPYASTGGTADHDTNRDPPDEDRTAKAERPSSNPAPPAPRQASKKKTKAARKQLKAPAGSDTDERVERVAAWSESQLEEAYHRAELQAFLTSNPVMKVMRLQVPGALKGPVTAPHAVSDKLEAARALIALLKEAGVAIGSFEAAMLFIQDFDMIEAALLELHLKLKALVGNVQIKVEPVSQVEPTKVKEEAVQLPRSTSLTGSSQHSQYASATSAAGSDSSGGVNRIPLGPSGAAMLQARASQATHGTSYETQPPAMKLEPTTAEPERMQSFFNVAMNRFLQEQQLAHTPMATVSTSPVVPIIPAQTTVRRSDVSDVEMESVGNHSREFDSDDLDSPAPRRAAVASATTGTSATVSATRIRVSAMSELKEFTGKDNDEDRARTWLAKVKSAGIRDQASEMELCLVFEGLLAGPARNWYRQLTRASRKDWKELLREFQTQYCGRGVSVARKYYHARKRSDESPLEYLYRLNVAGLRAKLHVKSGTREERREHIEHFIETLDDRELADQLAVLRIPDTETLEEILRSRQRTKARHMKQVSGSGKYRQKAPIAADATPKSTAVRKIHAARARVSSGSEAESGSSESEGEDGVRRMYLATTGNANAEATRDQDNKTGSRTPCSHCGSTKHNNLGCWKLLTCKHCGRKGHPSDRCLFVCRACGEIHDAGKCPMEEFYNLIHQWYNPTKHAGLLPVNAEKMLN